jgi:site-specific DNA recombinase
MEKDVDYIKPKKVFAYIRKSTDEDQEGGKGKQLNSLEYQRRVVKEIAQRNNLKIERIFEDSATGYKAYVRDDFNEMCSLLDEQGVGGEIEGLVCTEHNRLARNFGDGGRILWYLQNGEISGIYTYDKNFSNTSSDQMMLAINFAMAKHSSDETSFRIKESFHQKSIMGTPPNQRLVGYKYVGPKGNKVWRKDPIKAPLLVKVFEAYATGNYNYEELADYAFSIGLSNKNKVYVKNTISSWLSKEEYCGFFQYGGIRRKGDYPAIITDELFYKVKEVLLLRTHRRGKTKNTYAYSPRMIKCGVCGEFLVGDIQKGNVYYKCQKRKEPCKTEKSKRVAYLKESQVDETVKSNLKKIEISKKYWKELSDIIKGNYEYEKGTCERDIREYRTHINYQKEEIKSYVKPLSVLRAKSSLTKEEQQELEGYQSLMDDCHRKIEFYQKVIEKTENIKRQIPVYLEDFLESLKSVSSRFEQGTPSNKKAILETLCTNIIWDGKKVVWNWKNRYKNLVKQEKEIDWLPLLDKFRTINWNKVKSDVEMFLSCNERIRYF